MTTIQITLPDPIGEFVVAQAAAGGHASAGDYVVALLRMAHQATTRAAVEAVLVEGVESLERGEGREMTAADWQQLRDNVRNKYGEVAKS